MPHHEQYSRDAYNERCGNRNVGRMALIVPRHAYACSRQDVASQPVCCGLRYLLGVRSGPSATTRERPPRNDGPTPAGQLKVWKLTPLLCFRQSALLLPG